MILIVSIFRLHGVLDVVASKYNFDVIFVLSSASQFEVNFCKIGSTYLF